MPRLAVINRDLRYAGQQLDVGDEFDASDKDARILIGLRKAKVAVKKPPPVPEPVATPPPAPVARQPYQRRVMTPARQAVAEPKPEEYGRRDLQAENTAGEDPPA